MDGVQKYKANFYTSYELFYWLSKCVPRGLVTNENSLPRRLLESEILEKNLSVFSLSDPSIQMEIINKHNDLRRNTNPSASNMLKVSWNAEAAKNAKNWAERCTLSHSHPSQRKISFAGCGENLFMSSHKKSWSYVIESLHKEVDNFAYGVGATRANAITGHYTQLVWATSHQIGCAVAFCPQRTLKYYYVCQYCPAGNNRRTIKTPYKRGKPCEDCPDHCENGLCTNSCMHENKYSNCDDLKVMGCATKFMQENCPATCNCPSQIK
ncbi:cysteine-rich venom protein-like [Rhynchocyon petersi]